MCIDYFVKKGHKEVIAVLPQKYLKPDSGVENMEILQLLKEKGFLRLTPSGSFSTGAHFMSYDDRYAMMRYWSFQNNPFILLLRFLIQFAIVRNAVIVSNDRFRDLRNEGPNFETTINNRVLKFTWLDKNVLVFPKDPLGRRGPHLEQFLKFWPWIFLEIVEMIESLYWK